MYNFENLNGDAGINKKNSKMGKYCETEHARKYLYYLATMIQEDKILISEWKKQGVKNMIIVVADALGVEAEITEPRKLTLVKNDTFMSKQ